MLRRLLLSASLLAKSTTSIINTHKPHTLLRRVHEMAWLCSGNTNEDLIQNMKDSGLFESEKVAEVCSPWLLHRRFPGKDEIQSATDTLESRR